MIGETDMDGGPYRSRQPADRRVSARPEPTRRQPEEPQQPAKVEAKPVTSKVEPPKRATSTRKPAWQFSLPAIIVAVAALLGIVGWLVWSHFQNSSTAIDSDKYQAVFLADGQVYFGKLEAFNAESLKLTDIYYLQAQQSGNTEQDAENPQEGSSDQSDVQLIKLGNEIHGPEDQMIISKEQVLFYENLKPEGKVAQSIDQSKNQ